jgi:hypothetical protein
VMRIAATRVEAHTSASEASTPTLHSGEAPAVVDGQVITGVLAEWN